MFVKASPPTLLAQFTAALSGTDGQFAGASWSEEGRGHDRRERRSIRAAPATYPAYRRLHSPPGRLNHARPGIPDTTAAGRMTPAAAAPHSRRTCIAPAGLHSDPARPKMVNAQDGSHHRLR